MGSLAFCRFLQKFAERGAFLQKSKISAEIYRKGYISAEICRNLRFLQKLQKSKISAERGTLSAEIAEI
jgi:hypothetical protein